MWGGLCGFKQFLTKNNQIFTNKFRIPRKQPKIHKPKIDKAKLRRLTAGCMSAFKTTPVGREAMKHRFLAKVAKTASKSCGLDRYAKKNAGNKNAMIGSICTQTRMLVKKSRPSGVLCRVLRKCGSKSKKCDLPKKRPRGKLMARKRRVVKVNRNRNGRRGRRKTCAEVRKFNRNLRRNGQTADWCPWVGWSRWKTV